MEKVKLKGCSDHEIMESKMLGAEQVHLHGLQDSWLGLFRALLLLLP